MTLLESGDNVGALVPGSATRYDRQAIVRALRSTWKLRRRPRVGGAERHTGPPPADPHAAADTHDTETPPAATQPGETQPGELAVRWLRGLVPARITDRLTVTFDSWHHPTAVTELVVNSSGNLVAVNVGVVQAALHLINSGHSVVVQVRSGRTVRVWLCNGENVSAVHATTLENNERLNGYDTVPEAEVRFATAWTMTGEPGGVARPDR